MFTIFVVAVTIGVFVMYVRGEQQLRRSRRKASTRPIDKLPDPTAEREPERDSPSDPPP